MKKKYTERGADKFYLSVSLKLALLVLIVSASITICPKLHAGSKMTVDQKNDRITVPLNESSRHCWRVNDVAIIKNTPGASVKMPVRLFTPELITQIKQGGEQRWLFKCSRSGNAENAAQWSTIPAASWRSIISDFAPISIRGDHTGVESGKCPFCHKRFRGCSGITGQPFADLTKNPFKAKTICCGATVYGNPAAMPADYIAKPNHEVKIAHLDGTTREYVFFCCRR